MEDVIMRVNLFVSQSKRILTNHSPSEVRLFSQNFERIDELHHLLDQARVLVDYCQTQLGNKDVYELNESRECLVELFDQLQKCSVFITWIPKHRQLFRSHSKKYIALMKIVNFYCTRE